MSRVFGVCFAAGLAVAVFFAPAETRKPQERLIPYEAPIKAGAHLPPDLAGSVMTPLRSAAAADTFVLHDEDFDGWGAPDSAGYTARDHNEQFKIFWHVADPIELDGGTAKDAGAGGAGGPGSRIFLTVALPPRGSLFMIR